MADLFASPEMAAGYARSRPPVHPYVMERVRDRLRLTVPLRRALDVGCGAGLSTSPLSGLARFCLGVDPVEAMLHGTPAAAVGVRFATARAEALPVRAVSIDVLTAAGSLNYVDLDRFAAEAVRVLAPDGAVVVYDFSAGRSFRDSDALDEWFDEFRRRYPSEGSARSLDPQILASSLPGLRLAGSEDFEVALPLDPVAYESYVMTETNVAYAVACGEDLERIRAWCGETLAGVFGGEPHDVLFRGYLAHFVVADEEAAARTGAAAELRWAEPAEKGELEELMRRSSMVWDDTRADLLAHPDAIVVADDALAGRRVRVAVVDGRIVGFATVLVTVPGVGEVEDLFVAPDTMRQGFGRVLIDDAAQLARAGGLTRLEVTANPNALDFYERVGFVRVGEVATRFGSGVRMRRVIVS